MYIAYVSRLVKVHSSESWELSAKQIARFCRTEMRMVRWKCVIPMKEHWSNKALHEKIEIEIEPVCNVLRKNTLKCLYIY